MNRLADAVSPYLRGHADNPVDWYPWGEEAFAEAKRRDVPVLVSIGYATCHWCHVMARESFSDPQLARALNERFVAVKIDREEHPDVDSTYMAAASVFTPNLGWPLNVFTTPDGRAFFAGTYSPPRPVGGHPSFRQVLDAVDDAWRERRDEVERTAAGLAQALVEPLPAPSTGAAVDFAQVALELLSYEDREFGGFGGAPKFPVAPVLLLALRLGRSAALGDDLRTETAALAARTLDGMAASGLRDPVEGGFFRYATRRDWTEPHYERMLYDNAQLLRAYATRGDAATADGIVAFLRGVLRRDSGAFGSAQNSESYVDGALSEGATTRWMRRAEPASRRPTWTRRCSPAGTAWQSVRSRPPAGSSAAPASSSSRPAPPTPSSAARCRTAGSCARPWTGGRPRHRRRSRTTACSRAASSSSRWPPGRSGTPPWRGSSPTRASRGIGSARSPLPAVPTPRSPAAASRCPPTRARVRTRRARASSRSRRCSCTS
ncbi:thioredoxin domain-containing protein [Naasia aerilata]|uniref:Spermatogenesis-associated protein 20-like TRX domain-containing protein n=1 Tax=Naasia aerilata TaxID=1162966 RepID=A0ABM8G982_9MICO|nr:hypothetical protein GCM10025866_06460 [Naasia aerilata]